MNVIRYSDCIHINCKDHLVTVLFAYIHFGIFKYSIFSLRYNAMPIQMAFITCYELPPSEHIILRWHHFVPRHFNAWHVASDNTCITTMDLSLRWFWLLSRLTSLWHKQFASDNTYYRFESIIQLSKILSNWTHRAK